MKKVLWLLTFIVSAQSVLAAEFDHQHSAYAKLLTGSVSWSEDGSSSGVDYPAVKARLNTLTQYLVQVSEVDQHSFDAWSKSQQLAFLINAYNGFTLQLVLENYPVKSIKDIGRFWQSPWQQKFFNLLGAERSLDELEHQLIRESGRFNEPRIHFAVNCASLGCPALRPEPFTAEQLEWQLEDSTQRFLRDKSRNRYRDGELQVSAIFKWYRQDFSQGWLNSNSLNDFFLRYADSMELDQNQQRQLKNNELEYRFLPYDWRLNSAAE
ncbi:DUF547 domain-containing protein [Gilvimarinus polysaccharolyticus]|uniref:DUF547 domain-containing protein n=1 Tax=Gilvimarinus polysaccharolyticus TaxID=863921 RepID=UPI000673734D|nr:DUF547 domain-containing protein [Gilvimarinus polysaccharolyticus]